MSTCKQLTECVCPRTGRVIRVGDVEPIPDYVDRSTMTWIIRARAIRKSNDEKRERLREKRRRQNEAGTS